MTDAVSASASLSDGTAWRRPFLGRRRRDEAVPAAPDEDSGRFPAEPQEAVLSLPPEHGAPGHSAPEPSAEVPAGQNEAQAPHAAAPPAETRPATLGRFLASCRGLPNFARIDAGPLQAGLLVQDGEACIWAMDAAAPERKLEASLIVNGHPVWSGSTAPALKNPLLRTGYRLARHRTLRFSVAGLTAEAPAMEGWAPFPDAGVRDALARDMESGLEVQREAEHTQRLSADLPDLMGRLDRFDPALDRTLPPPYIRFLRDRFECHDNLSTVQSIGAWIIADVLEDTSKRFLFFLTNRILAVLSEPVFNRRVVRNEVTVALLAFWQRHYRNLDIFSDTDLRMVQFKFATAPYIAERNNARLVTPEMRERLRAPNDSYRDSEMAWSWYWTFLHADQRNAEKLRDPLYARLLSFRETIADAMRPSRLSFSPGGWRSYWRAMAGDRALAFSRTDLAMISLLANEALPEIAVASLGAEHWRERLLDDVYRRAPELASLSGFAAGEVLGEVLPLRALAKRDLAIIGHANRTGLGRNFTMFIDAFADLDPLLFNLDDGHCMNPDIDYDSGAAVRARVVLLCLNADRAPEAIARFPRVCEGAHIIAFYLWETDLPPETHVAGAHVVDEIWTPTDYVAEAYRRITNVPVTNIGKGLKLAQARPESAIAERIRTDPAEFMFLYVAEFGSGLVRKNPLDAILAFREAFADDEPVRLCLKIRGIDPAHWSNQNGYWEQIEEHLQADKRLTLISDDLSDDEYLSLVQSTDCYVSLHHAEGFGYGVADALLCHRPVIVSDYSGTRDFCHPETAFLVGVDERPVPPAAMRSKSHIGNWGVPRVAEAAAAMRRVYDDPAEAARRAEAGAARVADSYDMQRWTTRIKDRIAPYLAGNSAR